MFRKLSVILPVINETYSLEQTIDTILADCDEDIEEFVVVVCEKTLSDSLAICEKYKKQLKQRMIVHNQKLPFLGGAMREAFEIAKGSHLLMMASDLETDPKDVKVFIEKSKKNPEKIITATRWKTSGAFEGYSKIKLIANYIFQKIFGVLYKTNLNDLTYGYRLFPTKLVQSINWQELRHPFLFETILRPLKMGVEVIEIPTVWKARTEGESQNTFWKNFEYFKTGIKILFEQQGDNYE
jgi:glycosyltransferase involved in cell wall biosynthesis